MTQSLEVTAHSAWAFTLEIGRINYLFRSAGLRGMHVYFKRWLFHFSFNLNVLYLDLVLLWRISMIATPATGRKKTRWLWHDFSSNSIDIFSCFLQVIGIVLIIFNPFKFSRKRIRECDWLKVRSFIFTKTLPPMECTTHITGLLPTPAFRNLRLISSLRYIKDRLTREYHKAYNELST